MYITRELCFCDDCSERAVLRVVVVLYVALCVITTKERSGFFLKRIVRSYSLTWTVTRSMLWTVTCRLLLQTKHASICLFRRNMTIVSAPGLVTPC